MDSCLQLTSKTFTMSLETLVTRIHFTTMYHPKSNGLLERQHCQLKDALTSYGDDWMKTLPLVLLGLRNMPLDNNNITSAQMVYGLPCCLPGGLVNQPDATGCDLHLAVDCIKDCLPV